ncbi:MAG: DUF3021 domain-containing protein [Lachnospiraceae bacterium]|nr:DUF3021 domain-containing protein [Lachnospiraceae bacterium]
MKEILRRGFVSFAISAFLGLLVNLLIDAIGNVAGVDHFISMSPDFVSLFPTSAVAAYINVLLYGVIGASFAMMTFIFDCDRIGFVIQSVIYFAVTSMVCIAVTILLWQLHHYPKALAGTLSGYSVTYLIIGVIQYKSLKADIQAVNESLETAGK